MTELVVAMMNRTPPDELARRLLVTEPWPAHLAGLPIDAITFSGGVAEYIYGRERGDFGDLGHDSGARAAPCAGAPSGRGARSGIRDRASAPP